MVSSCHKLECFCCEDFHSCNGGCHRYSLIDRDHLLFNFRYRNRGSFSHGLRFRYCDSLRLHADLCNGKSFVEGNRRIGVVFAIALRPVVTSFALMLLIIALLFPLIVAVLLAFVALLRSIVSSYSRD